MVKKDDPELVSKYRELLVALCSLMANIKAAATSSTGPSHSIESANSSTPPLTFLAWDPQAQHYRIQDQDGNQL